MEIGMLEGKLRRNIYIMVLKSKLSAQWWWFDSQTNSIPRKSPWLHSTLAELDEKTDAMLKLIEEDADSFAKRAEMYYKKRPELINIVEDLYRAHRSVAERYDQLKFDSGSRHITPWTSCPLPLSKFRTSQLIKDSEKSYDSYSESFDYEHDYDSGDTDSVVVDDLEQEPDTRYDQQVEDVNSVDEDVERFNEEIMKLREEVEKLKEENKIQKQQLAQKDEEKMEAIRQLSFSVDFLKQENLILKTRFLKDCPNNRNNNSSSSNPFEFNKLKQVFWGRLFNGVVPL